MAPKGKKTAKKEDPIFFHQDPLFMGSSEGRDVRVLSEFMGPEVRFGRYGIENTIVFFGSARTLSQKDCEKQIAKAEKKGDATALNRLRRLQKVARYYDDARELGARLAKWNKAQHGNYTICTGGGPGIMEAGNRGAADEKSPTMALNIKLPFEQTPNPYITPELSVHFNYFFVRKYWFLYMAKALVVFPGGFGTLDELFETLTLIQTRKMIKPIPIVIFGTEFWKKLIHWDTLVETGMIDPEDMKLFKFCDTVDEAYTYLTAYMSEHAEKVKLMMHRGEGVVEPFYQDEEGK